MWWLAIPIGASLIAILFAFGLARWVLSHDTGTPEMKKVSDAIYTGAHKDGSTVAENRSLYPDMPIAKLVGKWRATHTSAIQYKNSYTGVMAPTNGNSFAYEFNADGTYSFNGLMQVGAYGCSTQIFSTHAGKYQLSRDILILEPANGSYETNQTCGSSGRQKKPADLARKQHRVHFEMQGDSQTLVVNDLNETSKPDYFRREK